MNIKITSEKINQIPCQAALIFVFQKDGKVVFPQALKSFSKETQELVRRVLEGGDFQADANQITFVYVYGEKSERILLVGLGDKKKFGQEAFVRALGSAAVELQKKKLTQYAATIPAGIIKIFDMHRVGLFFIKAIKLAQYQFSEFKDKKNMLPVCKELVLAEVPSKNRRKLKNGIEQGLVVSECINKTRHYGNLPPSEATPAYLADQARRIAKENKNVSVKILGKDQIEELKMGGILAVSKGSRQEPKLIVLEYRGSAGSQRPIVFVGKGITFDSGGINIKPSDVGLLDEMKADMGGGGSVLEIVEASARLGLKKNIVGIVPACENLLGGNAYKPGDIIRTMSSKTVEVKNTDAEGRIILADGLYYAKKYKPKAIIDLATLTGACMAALGYYYDGVFTRDERLFQELLKASKASLEQIWRLPLDDDYAATMKGEDSDLLNVGKDGRWGGACTAAAFLEQFVTGERWVHIDIAPRAFISKPRPWMRAGATGAGVHLGVEIIKNV